MVALVVEDGTIVNGANSYVTIVYVDTYVSNYHPENTSWAALTEDQKSLYIVRATRFFDRLLKWTSVIVDPDQALAFPRKEFKDSEGRVVAEDSIPELIKFVVSEFALEASDGTLDDDFIYLIQESLGSTSDTYSSPIRVGGSDIVNQFYKELMYYGYGRSKTSIVILERA